MRRYLTSNTLALLIVLPMAAIAGPEEDYREGFEAYRAGDLIRSMPPLRRAADGGHVAAQLQLGYILDWSEENAAAVRYYTMAAEAGNAEAQHRLAVMYSTGEGVAVDPAQVREWLVKSSAQDHAPAFMMMGQGYLDGRYGLPADEARAKEAFDKALALGETSARGGLDEIARREKARQRQQQAVPGATTAPASAQ